MKPRIDLMNTEIGAKVGKRIYNLSLVIEQASLPATTQRLVALRASQLNGCGWCVDIHTKEAAAAGETPLRLNLLTAWRHTGVFTAAERAALALTEEATRLTDADGVPDQIWAQVRGHYDDDQIAALVCLIAVINATNRLSLVAGLQGGSYQPDMFAGMVS